MKLLTKEIKIALVAIVGIVVLFFGMNFLKGINLFASDNTYYIAFSNIKGLTGSSPIMADGYQVGTVKSISYDFDKRGQILAEVGIDKKLKLPRGTTAEISSDLLGNVQVDLMLGDEGSGFLEPLSTISGMLNAGALGQVKEMVPQIEKMLPKVDSILASVNALLADPSLGNTVKNAEYVSKGLTTTTSELNALMVGLNKSVPGLMTKADGVLDNASTTMGNASRVTDQLSKLDLEGTLTELTTTLENLKAFTARLNENNGSLSLLMNDKSLYQNLNAMLAHADSLMVNLREHPKRYVHFSVFGKKDK